jgi:hypothetical protein
LDNASETMIEAELHAKGLNAPRLTPGHIDATITGEQYLQPEGTTLTICILTLFNGFTVTGESAAASPDNFDAGIGRRIARANAREKIWPLAGYLLKTRLWEAGIKFRSTAAPKGGERPAQLYDDLQTCIAELADLMQVVATDVCLPDPVAQRVGLALGEARRLVGAG